MLSLDQSDAVPPVEVQETEQGAPDVSVAIPSKGYSAESAEYNLWAEVLLRAVDDFKTYVANREDPDTHSVSKKNLRSILADGCDPEYWFFSDSTGFDAVCMALNVEPDVIRKYLRDWMAMELDAEPQY